MILNPFNAAVLSFAIATVLHLLALKLFPKIGLLDFPERYGLKRERLPYPTGILAIVTFLIIYPSLQPLSQQVAGVIGAVALLGISSFIDDRRRLPAAIRLLVQILVAIIVFGFGTRIYSITNPLVNDGVISLDSYVIPMRIFSDPPVVSGIFTILWLGLTINALNWFDGIPGQVSVLSLIGFCTIGILATKVGFQDANPETQQHLARLSFVLAGIAASCLLFDFPPNKVLMGDSGAMFFGLLLGIVTIYSGGKVATAFLALGVPLIDSGIVVIRRLAKGHSPFRGNAVDEHLHHRLLAKGWSNAQIIGLTATLGTAFGVTALYMNTEQKILAAVLLFLIMLALDRYTRPIKKAVSP